MKTISNIILDKSIKETPFLKTAKDSDGNQITLSEQMAYLTHFIQNHKISHKLSYSQKALEIIKEVSEYLNATDEGNDIVSEPAVDYSYSLFSDIVHPRFPSVANPKFTFIDLFAGIGGFRIALQSLGGKCVFSSEWDANAQKTYFYNFGEIPYGDITKESIKNCIPDGFDVLCAGFPCQAFSIAGYRKGFEDTRGTLFFDVAEIIKRKRPKAVFLENVKNLYTHDNGKTFAVIKATLEELGYVVYHKVMNSMEYANVPQNRERIFIVCFDPNQVKNHHQFSFPERTELTHTIHDCIDPEINDKALFYGAKFIHYEELKRDMVSMDTIYQWRRQYVRENKSNVCPTLTANMGTGGHNVPLILTKYGIRKLSPKECINFQGYPKEYQFPTSIANSAKYKQAGNSVVVPLITKVCQNIISII
ncbi:MAG: DNA cytosine methyltransferase [Sodaliphilus sp.]|jgi:DNA (cytosine-5)-methyltransferase 1|nr:DNA cytosine methyltransferase [Bacteroidales bacterium]MDY2591952.1 DNA cytosine methyltransferase [Sodaliphilus sp.]MCI6145573.1 DNA cytosine methyltransferase [Bacteroidales bacterium]MCI6224920.1 DNA cytosine methyltransferase [Bacteroidales bacterium]MCI6294110.1 DNA cytosine methyltransferase [Bacteroidales bacterium]